MFLVFDFNLVTAIQIINYNIWNVEFLIFLIFLTSKKPLNEKSERRKWKFCTFSRWKFSILVHCVACVCFNSHPPITILALDSCYDQIMASNYILLYYLLRNWFLNAQWNIFLFFMGYLLRFDKFDCWNMLILRN